MKYPIDADKYIAAMRIEFGENTRSEQLHREALIPPVNNFYSDGLHGEKLRVGTADEMIAEFAQRRGLDSLSESTRKIFTALIEWCTAAYQRGLQDAESGVSA